LKFSTCDAILLTGSGEEMRTVCYRLNFQLLQTTVHVVIMRLPRIRLHRPLPS